MKRIKKILEHFGSINQLKKTQSELIELLYAIDRYLDGKNNKPDVIDEIADCQIMLEQLKEMFGQGEVREVIEQKLNRTLERIRTDFYGSEEKNENDWK